MKMENRKTNKPTINQWGVSFLWILNEGENEQNFASGYFFGACGSNL